MNQNVNQETEVEEVYSEFFGLNDEFSQNYLDFLDSLEVVPVTFNDKDIVDDFVSVPYQENWWEEDEVDSFNNMDNPLINKDEISYCNPEQHYINQQEEENKKEELIDFNCERIYMSEVLDYMNEPFSDFEMDLFYNFSQPAPKYFNVSPFELIPQKKYVNF